MHPSVLDANAQALTAELNWLAEVLELRMRLLQGTEENQRSVYEVPPPELGTEQSYLGILQRHYQMTAAERLLLMLALAPRLKPELLLPLADGGNLSPHLGCIVHTATNQVLPSRQTALFLLGDNNLGMHFQVQYLLEPSHYLFSHQVLQFVTAPGAVEGSKEVLAVSEEVASLLTTGETYRPSYSTRFPASLLSTRLTWDDLVLPTHLRHEIDDIRQWILHGRTLMNDWGLSRKVKHGYRALFYGKPGTGKTLTATLLGQVTERPVYRVDLSMTISKYIGETEKNLKNLFDQAEHKDWILFFDEADALFSRRTESHSANDRHANQQVAYLLQRIEDYNGLIILSSNLPQGMDEAFTRRFESVINFPLPEAQQRLLLWNNYFQDEAYEVEDRVDFKKLAKSYELTGGSIIQILKFACIRAIGRDSNVLLLDDIMEGVRRAFRKEGKTVRV